MNYYEDEYLISTFKISVDQIEILIDKVQERAFVLEKESKSIDSVYVSPMWSLAMKYYLMSRRHVQRTYPHSYPGIVTLGSVLIVKKGDVPDGEFVIGFSQ